MKKCKFIIKTIENSLKIRYNNVKSENDKRTK